MFRQTDFETDTALARHVLHVHRHRVVPGAQFVPLDALAIKQYIAAARAVNLSKVH